MHTTYRYTCDAAKEPPFCGICISLKKKTVSAVYGNSDSDRFRIRVLMYTMQNLKQSELMVSDPDLTGYGNSDSDRFRIRIRILSTMQNLKQCELMVSDPDLTGSGT